jgi:Sporulation and spore germination
MPLRRRAALATRVTARWAVVAAASLVVLLVACDPGSQDSPEAISRHDVPFQLLETTSTTSTGRNAGTETPFSAYLVAGDRLVAVTRSAPGEVDARVVLRSLLEGPTADEGRLGITSAIPSGTRVRKVHQADTGVLTVDLARGFLTKGGDETLAVAQLVWTLTGLPGVDSVRFRVAGEPVQVPTGNRALARGAVTRDDFPITD